MVKWSKFLLIIGFISLAIGMLKGFLIHPFVDIQWFTPKTYLYFSNTAAFFAIALMLLEILKKK
ncbi:MAG: hypothetical protein A3C43_12360 [Candidatus Schekmanbacteria bacterium RIFCSPHIGHO2_02_FULL_38_11]|uniref:Uncharacterized protein n=1 Tax=Candidatus Schekmanbacteria bacterium RIFCSPLOWO2_12_FULL_38_15 TaxID=1817883 RepID=A0A1F7SHZ3_9BACT|nr:MAG: hypothetical protein A2043_00575 [Candidatus Schekmanbacteria bacterium GWA2_38_9]OGL50861.1 MAG: hypothetical protein A3H37_03365 [Candidatus Schekmanbacteria bacterium RIFCSPLOWO2_02_FULL_38_14]OGL53379.1 MAG: hypothetical protein A3G31_07700 [Candidatus Schekmanbacteria bacterium RIFCSPLOWO2_12_FULL_38_15]OGL55733.1 MAG: hypothetical protein A3C43_12360 [Candidatus Schekmanbacteria bacterium RIFCSPHIGHO2_02_FULL_38_11]